MRKLVIFFTASLCMTSCGSARRAASSETRDSLRVEVRTERIETIDTVFVEIPRQVERIVTRDTTSHLENDYATSDASIDASGYLHHSLSTKHCKVATPITTTREHKDSIIYRDREVTIEKPYPVEKKLAAWQQVRLKSWWMLAALLIASLAWKYRKKIIIFLASGR